jgi:hypothetical protein
MHHAGLGDRPRSDRGDRVREAGQAVADDHEDVGRHHQHSGVPECQWYDRVSCLR